MKCVLTLSIDISNGKKTWATNKHLNCLRVATTCLSFQKITFQLKQFLGGQFKFMDLWDSSKLKTQFFSISFENSIIFPLIMPQINQSINYSFTSVSNHDATEFLKNQIVSMRNWQIISAVRKRNDKTKQNNKNTRRRSKNRRHYKSSNYANNIILRCRLVSSEFYHLSEHERSNCVTR